MKILQLLLENKGKEGEFKVVQKGREATVYVYDVIGDDYYGGVSAKQFVSEIAALDVDVIKLRVNSPGGDVFAGVAMGQALKDHSAKVIAYIDGQAASAATRLTANADEVHIASGAFYMIHNSWTIAAGDNREFFKTANLLKDVDETIIADYHAKTGQSVEQLQQWMNETTWFKAEDAVKYGFANSVTGNATAEAKNRWNLAAYDNAPKELINPDPEPNNDINARATELRATAERRLALLERIAA